MRIIGRFLFASIALSGCFALLLLFLPHDAGQTPPPPLTQMPPAQSPHSDPPKSTTSQSKYTTSQSKYTTSQPKTAETATMTSTPSIDTTRKPQTTKRTPPKSPRQPPKLTSQQNYRKRCWKSGYSPTSGKPTNHTPGDFLINESRLCSGHITLLIIVHSEMRAKRRRDLARSTWASLNSVNEHRLAVVFVVGAIAGDARQQAALRSESAEEADLVQVPCQPDGDPSSSACKALYSLLWVSRHCRGAEFLLKVDDHVFVNVFHLADLVTGRLAGAVNTFYCRTAAKEFRIRVPHFAWYVSQEEWPGAQYPLHCKGLAYLMSADLVSRLLECAAWRNYLRLEDVFVTGVLGQALGARMLHWKAGWGSEWLHPKHDGPAVTEAIVLASQEGVPLPKLHRRVWKAALVYSADFV